MPLNPILKALIEHKLANTKVPQWEMPIWQVREAFAKLWTPAITGDPVQIWKVEDKALPTKVGRVHTRVYVRDERENPRIVMYFHGGGYVKGGLEEADAFCRRLTKSTGRIVVSVSYRLAPENPFPAALDDAYAATSWAFEHAEELGATPASFAVCGESAGGNLAAVVCLLAQAQKDMKISHQILLQPVTDFTLSEPSVNMPASECLVPRDDLAWYYREYCGADRDPSRPAGFTPMGGGRIRAAAGADHRRGVRHAARRGGGLCREAAIGRNRRDLFVLRRDDSRLSGNERAREGSATGHRRNRALLGSGRAVVSMLRSGMLFNLAFRAWRLPGAAGLCGVPLRRPGCRSSRPGAAR
jgi:acetyl esterase